MTLALVEPESIDETTEILATGDDNIRPVAGGSGLALMMRYGFFAPTKLVSLRRLRHELTGVTRTDDGGFKIGATTTLRDIEESTELAASVPMVRQAMGRLATVRLRNVAQIGGSVAHGAPQMDLPPVLLALDARVLVRSQSGERSIASTDLFLGYYQTGVESDELVVAVVLPPQGEHKGTYRKITARSIDDWPLLGIAAVARRVSDQPAGVSVAIGSLSDHAYRLTDVEEALSNRTPTAAEIRDVAEEAADRVDYHEGGMASPRYQRRILATNLRLALESVLLERRPA